MRQAASFGLFLDVTEHVYGLDKSPLTATQSSIYNLYGVDPSYQCKGSNVIDGVKDGDVETLFCPLESDPLRWVQIDLQQEYFVHEVREKQVFFQVNSCEQRVHSVL